jgi:hypothetical protein
LGAHVGLFEARQSARPCLPLKKEAFHEKCQTTPAQFKQFPSQILKSYTSSLLLTAQPKPTQANLRCFSQPRERDAPWTLRRFDASTLRCCIACSHHAAMCAPPWYQQELPVSPPPHASSPLHHPGGRDASRSPCPAAPTARSRSSMCIAISFGSSHLSTPSRSLFCRGCFCSVCVVGTHVRACLSSYDPCLPVPSLATLNIVHSLLCCSTHLHGLPSRLALCIQTPFLRIRSVFGVFIP